MKREVKAGVFALGIVGLLFVVALAARSGHPTSEGHVSARAVPDSIQDDLVTLLAIAYVVVIGAAIVIVVRLRKQWQEPESRWVRNFLSVMILSAIISVFGYWAIRHGHFHQFGRQGQAGQGQQQGLRGGRQGARPVAVRPAHFSWRLALSVAGLVLVAGVLLVLRRPRPLPRVPFPGVEEELARTLETTIDDLRSEHDARRAVIAAYAGMERALASHGFARHRAETPLEYLARVLGDLQVREGAVRSLTQLFEYAKFSQHEIDSGMKEEAIVALVEVRDELRREEAAAA